MPAVFHLYNSDDESGTDSDDADNKLQT